MSIIYKNYVDTHNKVEGYALVNKGFVAKLHRHNLNETYHFIYGIAKLYIDGEIIIIHSPQTIFIPANKYHAMTAISEQVLLFYEFPKGPFKSIKYKWSQSHL